MPSFPIHAPRTVTGRMSARFRVPAAILLLSGLALLATGCARVGISEQRLVSQPGMLFSESPVLAHQSKLLGQIEPGSAITGGGQAAGCTSCR